MSLLPQQVVVDPAELPRRIRTIEHVWIPMSDGTRLAARIWLPVDAEDAPVPAVFEYIPYRLTDVTSRRDERMHPFVAGHGYACVRVDLRGSGNSEGVLRDEYLEQELRDGEEVIAWLAAQPWCDGRVGMIGISWGGFNGLMLAARRPPALRGIVTVCSTDDRYADDVHYMGGCLLGDNVSWASTMFAYNTQPPDPLIVGESWREQWLARIDGSGLWLDTWLSHQHRDEYWRHGSVCEQPEAIECPVMAVSGWADGYSNAVMRMLERLRVPRRGLIGPWSHKYPHDGVPGPAIGFVQEVIRWWDRWLKEEPGDVDDEPMLRAWMQDAVPPSASYERRPGRWVAEPSWPSPNVRPRRYRLAEARLVDSDSAPAPGPGEVQIQSPLTVGQFAGKWCSYASAPDLPYDQREEDGGALVFETPPLEAALEILGAPVAELELAADRPVAMIAARLSDVSTSGAATRTTYGVLNLTHRDGHEEPAPLEPGRFYRVRVQLNDLAHSFPPGHRVRLSLSTSYWPLAWTPPEPTTLRVRLHGSHFVLPVRTPRDSDETLRRFQPATVTPARSARQLAETEHAWRLIRDLARESTTLEVVKDDGTLEFEGANLRLRSRALERYELVAADPSSARAEVRWERAFEREGWSVRSETRTLLTCDSEAFHLSAELDAYEGERRVRSLTWNRRIRRKLV